ncbi:MAG: DUF4238 domain-containing protein [Patescibacteria group bacterium]
MGKGKFANKLCRCGSGKKFKKCCMNKKQATPNFQQKKENNHYVPSGYQRRFISSGKKLHYLILDPYKDLPDGRKIKVNELYEEGPKNTKFFCEKDLYTTIFFGIRNEDIETFLFGKIDDNASEALDGLVANDPHRLHKYFLYIFEYIDAQKLRTPKGLDWIRSNYFQLTKNELLLEMQFLRTMHCTMWVEGVMEIVSAEDADIKFIVSDHPVTIYNYACPPDSKVCEYPNDPPTAWKASQTIFPLDLNHCLILTNLEYASSPDTVDPTSGRTNPRYFSQTITRWDTVIRERKLKSDEVCAINYIIKKRAIKHIAAGKKEWLYPEKTYNQDTWKNLRNILLPPKDQVYRFGGEIYVGGKDGGLAWYQDAYGRRHTSREDENDPIKKFSISKRNEILNNAIFKIFGFDEGKTWDDFRRELTDEKIKELYGLIGTLWNPDTEITKLLPKPDDQKLRAFYHGTLDPRITPLTIIGYSLYVDQIIICSPFSNPRAMNPKYSPYDNPSQYRDETIKNIRMTLDLMPLIDSNIVEMIPDPCDFNSELRLRTFKMAEARMKHRNIDEKDMDFSYKLMRQDFERSFFNLPKEILKHKVKERFPKSTDDEITKILEYIEKKKLADPLASLQPIDIDEKGQMHIYRGSTTHEMALYLAQITGSFVYTDIKHSWIEYKLAGLKRPDEKDSNPWEPLEKALSKYMLIMFIDPDPRFWSQIKERGYLKEFIDFYKGVLESIRTIDNYEDANAKAIKYVKSLKKIDLKRIFKKIEKDYRKEFKNDGVEIMSRKVLLPASYFFPTNGISSNSVTQILLTHGINTSYWKSAPFGVYLNLNDVRPLVKKLSYPILLSILALTAILALTVYSRLLEL